MMIWFWDEDTGFNRRRKNAAWFFFSVHLPLSLVLLGHVHHTGSNFVLPNGDSLLPWTFAPFFIQRPSSSFSSAVPSVLCVDSQDIHGSIIRFLHSMTVSSSKSGSKCLHQHESSSFLPRSSSSMSLLYPYPYPLTFISILYPSTIFISSNPIQSSIN